jgi:hypothetical protein
MAFRSALPLRRVPIRRAAGVGRKCGGSIAPACLRARMFPRGPVSAAGGELAPSEMARRWKSWRRGRTPTLPLRGLLPAAPDRGPHLDPVFPYNASAMTARYRSFATGHSLTVVVPFGTASVSERPGNGAKSHGRRPRSPAAWFSAFAGDHFLRSCEEIGRTAGLTDESVCPTLHSKDLQRGGAGASACQPISSQLLSERFRNSAEPRGHGTGAMTARYCSFATGHSLTAVGPFGTASVSERPGNATKSHGRRPGQPVRALWTAGRASCRLVP